MASLKSAVDSIVYASVLLGLGLLYLASYQVPAWLLWSLVGGEIAYGATAYFVFRGHQRAYYAVIVLALVVLAASLPQPEHYSFASQGEVLAFAVFAVGSGLQVALIVLVSSMLLRRRRGPKHSSPG